MNITNEAVKALVLRAYEQGYETGYIVGRDEKDNNDSIDSTWGAIYEEFKFLYPTLSQEVVDYRPYKKPYVSKSETCSILLYMKNGEKRRYDYVTKDVYFIKRDELINEQ